MNMDTIISSSLMILILIHGQMCNLLDMFLHLGGNASTAILKDKVYLHGGSWKDEYKITIR